MKKSFYSIAFLFSSAIIVLTSCTKKLDETLYGSTTASSFYKSADQITAAYVLPYSYMQTQIYQTHFQDVEFVTDEACVPVLYGYVDQGGQWVRFHQHTWSAQDAWILYEWQNLYQAIGYSSNFITNMRNIDVSSFTLPVSKERMIADIRMVRALHYYWALSEFGNIPVVDSVGVPNPPNNTPTEAFTFIDKEIKESIPALGEKGDGNWYGHFTRSAAYTLLAKLYLNAQAMTGVDHYQDCITACDSVISSGEYSLDANWNDPFKVHNELSNENIYVVPFDANNAQNFNFIEQDIHPNITQNKYGNGYGWRKISTQESFFDLFADNDLRKNQWLYGPQTYTDDDGNEQPVPSWETDYSTDPASIDPLIIDPHIDDFQNADDKQGVMNVKYEIENGLNYGSNGYVDMNNDMVVFRYADILMMKAECLMRLNGGAATQEAVNLVNSVRQRSFSATDFKKAKYTPTTLTMNELLSERGREFAYEMFRREGYDSLWQI